MKANNDWLKNDSNSKYIQKTDCDLESAGLNKVEVAPK